MPPPSVLCPAFGLGRSAASLTRAACLRTAFAARGMLAAGGWKDVPSWELVAQATCPPDRVKGGTMGTLIRWHPQNSATAIVFFPHARF